MNKETRKAKKVSKARKQRASKKTVLKQERESNRYVRGILKKDYLKEKKERSKVIVKARQEAITRIKKILGIPSTEHMSLEALVKLYKTVEKAVKADKKK